MRKYLRKFAGAAIALMLAGPVPGPASAHAIIVSATPTIDQHVPAGKLSVRIEFNSRLDKMRSRLQVTAPSGVKSNFPIDPAGRPKTVTGTARQPAQGL